MPAPRNRSTDPPTSRPKGTVLPLGAVRRTSISHSVAGNSLDTVSRLLRHYGVADVELVQADIARVPESRLPERVAVGLVDVDLEVPVYEGLQRLYPHLADGGVLLVDDCPPGDN